MGRPRPACRRKTCSPYVCTRWGAERVQAHLGQRIKSWRGAWEAACLAAGHPQRLVHDFCRTAIRNLTRAGVSEQIAMEMVGHRTAEIFGRYNITHPRDLQDAAAKLGERLQAEIGRSYGKVAPIAQGARGGRSKAI